MSNHIDEIKKEIRTAKQYMTSEYQFTNTYYRDGYIQGLKKAMDIIRGVKENPLDGIIITHYEEKT